MFCPECGTKNSSNAAFCKKCGENLISIPKTSIENSGKCPYCAEDINPNAVKCKHCGEWLNKEFKTHKEEDYSAAIILGIIFTIFGGVIGLIISFYLVTREDEKAKNVGLILLIVNIIWIFLLLIIYASWMSYVNSLSYYYY